MPRREPPLISADEAYAPRESGGPGGPDAPTTPYVQEALAVDLDDGGFDPQPTRRAALPEPEPFSRSIGQALVEVMWGARPAPQVVRWTSAEVYAVVARRALVAARRGLRQGRAPVIRRVRVCEPADGVAEVSLVVVTGDRVHAMAMRLIGLDGRWVVTELLVG